MFDNNYKTNECGLFHLVFLARFSLCLLFFAGLPGCIKHQYIAAPIQQEQSYNTILATNHNQTEFKTFIEASQYVIDAWPIEQWDLDLFMLAAAYFNPSVKVAASELAVKKANVVIAGQKPNPRINVPFENRTDFEESPWLLGVIGDFLFERKSKRQARIDQAEAEIKVAEIALQQQLWQIYSTLSQNYIEYFLAVKVKAHLIIQSDLLNQHLELLERRREMGQVSQFEVSSIRLQLQQLKLRLSDQEYTINNTFHRLVATTGLQASKFDKQQLVLTNFDIKSYSGLKIEKDLREQALNNHFDLLSVLQKYEVMEAALKLEIEKQYPDINLSPGLLFDQGDAVWTLGAAWVLPVFHNNDGQILEALALRKQKQTEFIELQTHIINELARRYQNYKDRVHSYKITRKLLDELESQVAQIQKQFDLGYADSLSVVRTQLEYEKAKQALFLIEVDLLKSLQQLEDITQQPFNSKFNIKMLADNLRKTNTEN